MRNYKRGTDLIRDTFIITTTEISHNCGKSEYLPLLLRSAFYLLHTFSDSPLLFAPPFINFKQNNQHTNETDNKRIKPN